MSFMCSFWALLVRVYILCWLDDWEPSPGICTSFYLQARLIILRLVNLSLCVDFTFKEFLLEYRIYNIVLVSSIQHYSKVNLLHICIVAILSLSCVRLFVTPWTAACLYIPLFLRFFSHVGHYGVLSRAHSRSSLVVYFIIVVGICQSQSPRYPSLHSPW